PVVDERGRRLLVRFPQGTTEASAQVWEARHGKVRLLLLDTDLPENPPQVRALCQKLYGGDNTNRLGQEILLGIGGPRLLAALELEPDVYHLNEGHASFVALELWARHMATGAPRQEAWEQVCDKVVFTTHTPVPAGHDRFHWDEINHQLQGYRQELDLDEGSFMRLGRTDPHDLDEPLCMTVLALHASRAANGVSELHGEVSRKMWNGTGVRIDHITNGVHPTAWLAPQLATLWDEHLPGWRNQLENPSFWEAAEQLPTPGLLRVRRELRGQLVDTARERLGCEVLDPDGLILGFARRFAPYKRAHLLFRDPDRLAALVGRGLQVVFAGKAHPRDGHGQDLLAQVVRWSRDRRFRDHIVFIPGYDAGLGRCLTQGADVWLNTPRRPREASGTSGQKAALNGNPNCSILDGWWPEAYDGDNGWAIGGEEADPDPHRQDAADAEALYRVLEDEVLPSFGDREGWARRMAHVMTTCVPHFNTHRMVREYVHKLYRTS
ncbi:MAG: alpha-glucan family phosphorylase, partial [Myxococcota bacterium]|nr:alpha-glucan family phosphorylase [Myxococcota bacterium]